MEPDPNMNFGMFPQYTNQQLTPFQSIQINHGLQAIQPSMNCSNGSSSTLLDGTANFTTLTGNTGLANGVSFAMPPGNSSVDMVLSPARRLVHGPALSIEWSPQEQAILKHGLEEYANDPAIAKYVKIAAKLRYKTVRDVAMRCQWMKKKENDRRQKLEGLYTASKIERLAASIQNGNAQFIQQENRGSFSMSVNNSDQKNQIQIQSEVWCIIDENNKILKQIVSNLEKGQMQNSSLFHRVGNNIATVLLSTNAMSGVIRRMPPLPSIDWELYNSMGSESSMAQVANINQLPVIRNGAQIPSFNYAQITRNGWNNEAWFDECDHTGLNR